MKTASLTNHAKKRISERCSLSESELRQLLDAGAGIHIHLQKGGRYSHRLIYSHKDEDWFMVVQDGGDGGVLTLMPLEFLKGRTEVTAAHKRQARRKAIDVHAALRSRPKSTSPLVVAIGPTNPTSTPPPAEAPKQYSTSVAGSRIWRIRVRYMGQGKTVFKMLPWVPVDYGDPAEWSNAGPIHAWLKERLIEAQIPIGRIEGLLAVGRKQDIRLIDYILEHLPLTEDEINSCR